MIDHRYLTPLPDPPQPSVAPPTGNLEEPEWEAWESADEDDGDPGDQQVSIPFRLTRGGAE